MDTWDSVLEGHSGAPEYKKQIQQKYEKTRSMWHRLPVAGTRKVAGTPQVAQVSIGGTGLNQIAKQMGRHQIDLWDNGL